jgi:microcin C transport system substrate-binding protein
MEADVRVRLHGWLIGLVGAMVMIAGCGGGSAPRPAATTGNAPPSADPSNVSLDKNSYPVFPNADAGADPAVSAEQGGRGFKGEGWETSTDFDLIGDPRAVKGGTYRSWLLAFPGTLRMAGPEWNTSINYGISALVYETLLALHPTTLKYIPVLATHWQIAPDKLTYRFRIDPNAKFSDGTPVTAEDVVASWTFHTDKSLQDLYFYTEFNRLEKPVAESKYIVRIKAKELKWSDFLMAASGLRVFPSHVMKGLNGAAYLKDYNFKLLPGSGPYTVNEGDIRKGAAVSIRRRKDYWAERYRASVGQYNFDELRYTVVRDQNLAFEQFKRGDLDHYTVNISQQWVQELNYDDFQRGVIVKRKVYNNYPANTQFLAFNTRRQPWDDVRVRRAFALLLNRAQLIKTLFFNEYLPLNSYFPGTIYENANNPKNEYNPQEALKLLAEAGWTGRDQQGRLVKSGRPLQIELLYSDKGSERWLTVYQEDLRKVGIGMNLRLVNPETRFKMQMQRQFELVSGAWGVGSVFPTVRSSFHSETADVNNTVNISGFKDKRVDELCEQYEIEFDLNKRAVLVRELDGILANQHHYIMQWYPPSHRFAYWNRFGMPSGTLSRHGDEDGSLAPGIPQLWWVDPAKSQQVQQGLQDKSLKMEIPAVEDRYWQQYSDKEQTTNAISTGR